MKIVTIFLGLFICINLKAQFIKGKVINEQGAPVSNCTILKVGERLGTKTNDKGEFYLQYKNQSVSLQFSLFGYQTQKIEISTIDTIITVILRKEKKELYEVVVTAVSVKGIKIKGSIGYNKVKQENDFIKTACEPFSTFSIDDDKASYSYIRRLILEKKSVPPEIVKLEEMINYFDYTYEDKNNNNIYNFFTELTTCPWNDKHQLMRVALKSPSLKTVTDIPSNYVFLVDVSGSMSGEDRLPLVKKSLLLLLDSLQKNDLISIVTYAGKSGIVLEATEVSNKKKITDAINKLKTGGRTAGSKGIEVAYNAAEENFVEDGNNRVILATDGDFNVGLTSYNDLEKLITQKKETGIYLTCLGFGTGNYKDKTMELLADKGNGNYYYISDTTEAKRVLQKDFKGTIHTVATDVKIQVEFNTKFIKSYRLLGYENRLLKKEDFNNDAKDAGEMGEGHTVTALYELETNDVKGDETEIKDSSICIIKGSNNMEEENVAIIRTRYKMTASSKSKKIDFVVLNTATNFSNATNNTKWASCVAMFGMILQDSEYKGSANKETILRIAMEAINKKDALQEEFINLVKNWNYTY